MTCVNGYCTDGETCTTELASVAAGARHACGIDPDGRAICWGDNRQGQLGVPEVVEFTNVPRVVDTDLTFTAIAAGGDHSCALSDGKAWCWGQNDYGQARGGRGGTASSATEVTVSPASPPPAFEQIAVGGSHSCAIGLGELWCWGRREYIGFASDISFITRFGMRADWLEVATGGDHTCGIAGSELLCWGRNDSGQLATTASNMAVLTPVVVDLGGRIPVHVAAGNLSTCAIAAPTAPASEGEMWCWGRNYEGQLDDMRTSYLSTPTRIGSDADWTSVTVGDGVICGLRAGRAWCWGEVYGGGLGNGAWYTRVSAIDPLADLGPTDAIVVATNRGASPDLGCVRRGTSTLCWGENWYGEVGIGQASSMRPIPVAVAPPPGLTWTGVWAGDAHTCAQTTDGALWCWGADSYGQITTVPRGSENQPCLPGQPCDYPTPRLAHPTQLTPVDEVVTAERSTCVRQADAIICWGDSSRGGLGVDLGNNAAGTNTVAPPVGQAWSRLLGGHLATCGVMPTGQLACWGTLPDTNTYTPELQNDSDLGTVTAITFGNQIACAMRNDMWRVCWGRNDSGQMGPGFTSGNYADPFPIANDVTTVIAYGDHMCGLTPGQNVVCWGYNSNGQTGQPTTLPNVPTPTPVKDANGVDLASCTVVASAYYTSCAICGGIPSCWGSNSRFLLGRGPANGSNIAQAALVPAGTYVALAMGDEHACALDQTGQLYCWGFSLNGQIGDGGHGVNLPTLVAPAH